MGKKGNGKSLKLSSCKNYESKFPLEPQGRVDCKVRVE
jgi:hypothetical protein